MAYNINQNQSKYFFLASYQLFPGVENKIMTKKYFRGGQKIENLHFSLKISILRYVTFNTQNQFKYIFFLQILNNTPPLECGVLNTCGL